MRVYKFRSLSASSYDFTAMIISNQEIWFSKPKELNDPFEYATVLDFEATLEQKLSQPIHGNDLIKMASAKFEDWGYEDEVRFFCSPGAHKIPSENIASVTFGLNCRSGNYDAFKTIYNLVRQNLPSCRMFECKKIKGYAIDRIELDRSVNCL